MRLILVNLTSGTDYFFSDYSSLSLLSIIIQRCYFKFENLQAGSGFLFSARNISIVMESNFFYLRSTFNKKFSYFIKSTNNEFSIFYSQNSVNYEEFDNIFYLKQTNRSSINISNLIINDEKFSGRFFLLTNEDIDYQIYDFYQITIKDCWIKSHSRIQNFIFLKIYCKFLHGLILLIYIFFY